MDDITDLSDVSRETMEKLEHFADLVRKWTAKINLVSRKSLPDLWNRHIIDSAQLARYIPDSAQEYLDIGSGGGFPGIVLAIMGRFSSVTFIESDKRKSVFLRQAGRDLDLPVHVISDRIEMVPPIGADFLTARALAPLNVLLSHAIHHLKPGGVALFPKGQGAQAEIDEAKKQFSFSIAHFKSVTDPSASILRLEGIERAEHQI